MRAVRLHMSFVYFWHGEEVINKCLLHNSGQVAISFSFVPLGSLQPFYFLLYCLKKIPVFFPFFPRNAVDYKVMFVWLLLCLSTGWIAVACWLMNYAVRNKTTKGCCQAVCFWLTLQFLQHWLCRSTFGGDLVMACYKFRARIYVCETMVCSLFKQQAKLIEALVR